MSRASFTTVPTDTRIFLTKTDRDWWWFKPSFFHSFVLRNQSLSNIKNVFLCINVRIPKSLIKHWSPWPCFLVLNLFVTDLWPHAGFSTDDINILRVGIEFIEMSPTDKCAISNSSSTSKSKIKIGEIVIRKNNLVCSVCNDVQIRGESPPMNYIIRLCG